MRKFELNSKETLTFEVESRPIYAVRRDQQIYLFLSLILLAGTVFFGYAYWQFDETMYIVLMLIFGLSFIGGFSYYSYKIVQALRQAGQKKYLLTDSRLVTVDKNNEIIKEILLNKIKRVDLEQYGVNTGTILINKKIDVSRKGLKKQRKSTKPVYSADTYILESINNVKRLTNLLNNR